MLEEVDSLESSSINVDLIVEETEEQPVVPVIIEKEREDLESVQYFVQRGEEVSTKTLKFSPIEMIFGDRCMDSLHDTVTPMTFNSDYREHRFEDDNIFSLTNFYGSQRRYYY